MLKTPRVLGCGDEAKFLRSSKHTSVHLYAMKNEKHTTLGPQIEQEHKLERIVIRKVFITRWLHFTGGRGSFSNAASALLLVQLEFYKIGDTWSWWTKAFEDNAPWWVGWSTALQVCGTGIRPLKKRRRMVSLLNQNCLMYAIVIGTKIISFRYATPRKYGQLPLFPLLHARAII